MRPHPSEHLKGFTLIELILTMVIVVILSVAALSSYVRSQDAIRFLSAVNQSANVLKEVRSLALSNATIDIDGEQQVPMKYGACIVAGPAGDGNNKIITFADKPAEGATVGKYDAGKDHTFKEFALNDDYNKYSYLTNSQTAEDQPCKFTFLYDPTNARFSFGDQLSEKSYAYVNISEIDTNGTTLRSKYIILFRVSGNPEVMDNLPDGT